MKPDSKRQSINHLLNVSVPGVLGSIAEFEDATHSR
jgi:hypothetical protein